MHYCVFPLPGNDQIFIGNNSCNILNGGFLRRLGLSKLLDVIMEQLISVCFLFEENFLLCSSLLVQHAIEHIHDDVAVESHPFLLRIRYLVARLYHIGTELYIDILLAFIQKLQSTTFLAFVFGSICVIRIRLYFHYPLVFNTKQLKYSSP